MRILLLAHAPSVHTQRWRRALVSRGHEVRLLSVVPAAGTESPGEPVGWPSAPISLLRYAAARGAVRAILAEWRPDVTVAHFLPNYGFLAATAGATPFALVAWGSDLLVNATRTPLHRMRANYVLRNAALVHVDAVNLAEAAVRLGAPAERVWTRPWGVDVAGLAPTAPWEDRFARAGGLRVLWTRMLAPLYLPETFVEALGLLRKRGVAFRATIAGDGPSRGSLETMAAALGIADATQFVGMVDESRLRTLYREHEVYVSMSRSDSTSQSLLEAMAAGLAVVASDIPGNRPWLHDAGRLVKVGDAEALAVALATLVTDRETGARVERGLARVGAEANWSETVSMTEAKLRALTKASGA